MEAQRERGGTRFGVEKPILSQATVNLFEVLFRIFQRLEHESGVHRDDFRIALLRTVVRSRVGRGGQPHSKHHVTLNFWCLNPAVAFSVNILCYS